jgi:acyl carrier protein
MNSIFKKKKADTSTNESYELVKQLVTNILGDDSQQVDLKPDTKFENIGFDSIKFINLLLSLEDLIDIDLEVIAAEIDPSSIQTLNDIVELLDKLKKR